MTELRERFWAKVNKEGPVVRPDLGNCWLWVGGRYPSGYGSFGTGGRGKSGRAHRVAWSLTYGEIPDGIHVLHKCDTPACVRPAHLFLGDHRANMADMANKGRRASGEVMSLTKRGAKHPAAKLAPLDVQSIRRRYAEGESSSAIGLSYGVSRQTVADIAAGRTWGHLENTEGGEHP